MPRINLSGRRAATTGPSYVSQAVVYDGSTNYLHRNGNFTGDVDGPLGILSLWLNVQAGNGVARAILRNTSSATVNVSFTTSNFPQITLSNSGNSASASATSTIPLLSGTGWHHLLCAWDTNHAAGLKILQMYIDGINANPTVGDTFAAFNVDYTRGDTGIGAAANGINKFTGYMTELYFNDAEYIDISNLVNRYKFRGLTDRPADMGATGSIPTGTAPICYLRGPAAAWATNLGTGGNLTAVGVFTDAPSAP